MTAISKLTTMFTHSFLPESVFISGVNSIPSEDTPPKVYLTFDDGPDKRSTPLILDQLDLLDVKATFFIEGRKLAGNSSLIQRIYDSGHSIGTHSWSHNSVSDVSNKIWIEDVQRARLELESMLGVNCPLFRAPYGRYNPIVVAKLITLGYRMVHWNFDTKDYQMHCDKELVSWFLNHAFTKESIVLMHDNHSPATHCLLDAVGGISSRVTLTAVPMAAVLH